MRKNPAYTHLLGTILLLIFSKKSHLYFYSLLKFHIFFSCLFHCLFFGLTFDSFTLSQSFLSCLIECYKHKLLENEKKIPPIRLLIFSKKSHLYVYSVLYFYYFLRNFPTYIFIQTRRLFGTLE